MYNDIDWTRKGHQEVRVENSSRIADFAIHFTPRTLVIPRTRRRRRVVRNSRVQAGQSIGIVWQS